MNPLFILTAGSYWRRSKVQVAVDRKLDPEITLAANVQMRSKATFRFFTSIPVDSIVNRLQDDR